MDVCFWCRRKKDEGDNEGSPMYNNYDKCLECATKSDMGIMVIQVTTDSNGNPQIHPDLYPTGKWVVISRGTIEDMFTGWEGLPDVLETGHTFMDTEVWENYKLPN